MKCAEEKRTLPSMFDALPREVSIVEVSLRDGLQNEAKFVSTEHKLELVQGLAANTAVHDCFVAQWARYAFGDDPDATQRCSLEALRALPFPEGVRVLRPSMLLGDRGEMLAACLRMFAPLFKRDGAQ